MKKTMKTTFLLTALLVMANCFNANSQNTTEQEYNWLTKGYKDMIATGGDVKKGYYFDDNAEYTKSFGDGKITFKLLKREKDKSVAGTLVIAYFSGWASSTNYYCIPALDYDGNNYAYSALMDNFSKSVENAYGAATRLLPALAYYQTMMATYHYGGK